MRGEMDQVMQDVVTGSKVVIACITDDYFIEGSNAQYEYQAALEAKVPGVTMLAAKVAGAPTAAGMTKVSWDMPLKAVYDLSGSGAAPSAAVDQMVDKALVFPCIVITVTGG